MYRTTWTMRARDAGRGLNCLETDTASPCFQFYKRGLVREGQNLHPEGPSCPGGLQQLKAERRGQLPLPLHFAGQEPGPGTEQAFFSRLGRLDRSEISHLTHINALLCVSGKSHFPRYP